ncbi:MAG TPA: PAS-domain containing protein [Dongiaceae bacterium]|nr:PAS-domain containing protein [Dongiaceae bacterium]
MTSLAACALAFAAGAAVGGAAVLLLARRELYSHLRLFRKIPLAVWRRDAKGAIRWASDAAWSLFGSPPRKEFDATAAKLAERARRTNIMIGESRSLVVDGAARIIEAVELPLADGSMVGYAFDYTELERVQAELARHVSAHREMLESLHTGIFIFGQDRRLVFYNRAGLAMFELGEEQVQDNPTLEEWLTVLRDRRRLPEYPDFRSFTRDFTNRVLGTMAPTEELIHTSLGQTFRMLANPYALGGTILTFEDVTDLLALERNYNTLIDVQKETIDHLIEGIAVLGGDGRLKLFNRAFVALWRLDTAQLRGEPHVSRFLEKIATFFSDHSLRQKIIDDSATRKVAQFRAELNDGRVIDILGVPLPDGSRLYQYADITDTIEKERALQERNAALLAADRLKSEFIANVSYEFRTPLNAIVGYAELLKRQYFGALNERQVEYTDAILRAAHELVELIGNVIDVAAIEAGYIQLHKQDTALAPLLEDCLKLLRSRQMAREVHILVHHRDKKIPTIQADPQRLKQAFSSLFSVAIASAPNHGIVQLDMNTHDNVVDIIVTQGDPDETGEAEGSSRGHNAVNSFSLSLVKMLVEMHGGQMFAQIFPMAWRATCRLPLQQHREPAQEAGQI